MGETGAALESAEGLAASIRASLQGRLAAEHDGHETETLLTALTRTATLSSAEPEERSALIEEAISALRLLHPHQGLRRPLDIPSIGSSVPSELVAGARAVSDRVDQCLSITESLLREAACPAGLTAYEVFVACLWGYARIPPARIAALVGIPIYRIHKLLSERSGFFGLWRRARKMREREDEDEYWHRMDRLREWMGDDHRMLMD